MIPGTWDGEKEEVRRCTFIYNTVCVARFSPLYPLQHLTSATSITTAACGCEGIRFCRPFSPSNLEVPTRLVVKTWLPTDIFTELHDTTPSL